MTGNNIRVRATTRIQTYVRMRRARREYIILRKQIGCAVKLQALFRSTIQKIRAVSKYKIQRGLAERNMKKNQYLLKNTWTNIPKGKRLLIHIPSVSCDEYIRLSMSNISVLHNAHISSLWQLVHPDVHIIYVSTLTQLLLFIEYDNDYWIYKLKLCILIYVYYRYLLFISVMKLSSTTRNSFL
jgi:hypothetical protein